MAKKKPANAVTIRMYCQGLGDCFLLTFPPASGTKPVRVLIDCGVLQHTKNEAKKMQQVAAHLHEETDGHIDLLIVTHEHWDHVAGFAHAHETFEKKFTFDHVWLSWAENPADADAKKVKTELGKKKAKLQAALGALGERIKARGDDPFAARLREDLAATRHVLDFFGPTAAAPAAAKKSKKADGGRMTLGETMDWLRAQVQPGDFCSPGERRELPGADGVNVYVLGPPRSVKSIRKMDPTGDQGYKTHADRVSLLGALDWLASGEDGDPPGPFDDRYRVRPAEAAGDPFFRECYGFPDDPLGDAGAAWRRIDDEWLGGVGKLALQLDTGVNNTSLALAFELPGGRTLIFPGDAQIGNWLSWDDVKFKDETGHDLPVTAKQLLNRAVFYKVGHHGSHNATRKVGGLEEMTGGELVAMIPTDEAFALTQSPPHGWKMPYKDLNDALKTFTNHRILRADRDKDALAAEGEETDAPAATWAAFTGRVTFATKKLERDPNKEKDAPDQPLYVEYSIPA
jgi:hypothetical protein